MNLTYSFIPKPLSKIFWQSRLRIVYLMSYIKWVIYANFQGKIFSRTFLWRSVVCDSSRKVVEAGNSFQRFFSKYNVYVSLGVYLLRKSKFIIRQSRPLLLLPSIHHYFASWPLVISFFLNLTIRCIFKLDNPSSASSFNYFLRHSDARKSKISVKE